MSKELKELTSFLRDRNPEVRRIALENLLPQTVKGAPHRDIFFAGLQSGGLGKPKESDVLRDLKLLCRDQLSVAHDAFRALVNLSDSPLMIAPLSDVAFLKFIVSYIINPHSILADLASMLLCNLTASSPACAALLIMQVPVIKDSRLSNSFFPVDSRSGSCPDPVPYPSGEVTDMTALPLLIDAFVEGAQLAEDLSKRTRKGELHFLANVFANMTTALDGRKYFLSPQPVNLAKPESNEYPLAKLVVFAEHANTVRRSGVASTIKNCSFHTTGHRAILSPESVRVSVPPSKESAPGIDTLPYLLLPLAGGEEFDFEDQEKLLEPLQMLPPTKTRESDPTIRLTHIETLLLLCHTQWGRDYLRQHGVYPIIRVAHENEKVDRVSEHIERLVQLIHGEEPKNSLPEGDLEDIELDLPTTEASSASLKQIEQGKEESDDEDMKIEEI